MSNFQNILRDRNKLNTLAAGLAAQGIEPPRDLMVAGMQRAVQKAQAMQQSSAAQGGAPAARQPQPPQDVAALMAPQQRTMIPQSMPQVPFAPSTPSPVTGIEDLMTPRR